MDDIKGLVIDPYSGSGTTLVAAKLLGHDYIGIEISKEYANSAEIRLLNYENERRDALSEIAKHIVTRLSLKGKQMVCIRVGMGLNILPKRNQFLSNYLNLRPITINKPRINPRERRNVTLTRG
jgi:hypothetical protein